MTRQDRNCEVVKEICRQFSSLRKPLRQLSAHRYIVHWTFPLCILRVPDGTSSCSFFSWGAFEASGGMAIAFLTRQGCTPRGWRNGGLGNCRGSWPASRLGSALRCSRFCPPHHEPSRSPAGCRPESGTVVLLPPTARMPRPFLAKIPGFCWLLGPRRSRFPDRAQLRTVVKVKNRLPTCRVLQPRESCGGNSRTK